MYEWNYAVQELIDYVENNLSKSIDPSPVAWTRQTKGILFFS